MQMAYKAELDRLTKEGIIIEEKEHTEWINSIVPVMKSIGSLRLCLDPKDLNKVIERNQWYSRTIDDILPELAKSKYKTLKDATSGYWHIVLGLASSLLTMFNTPWGQIQMVEVGEIHTACHKIYTIWRQRTNRLECSFIMLYSTLKYNNIDPGI